MIKKQKLKLTDERTFYKPFTYPWAYEAWLAHEQSHWLFSEVPMNEDIKDWKNKLTDEEKKFLTNILRFFTQGDIDVAGGYVNNYLPIFKQPEVRMMLLGFAAREAIHIAAYSHLIESLGLPESTYHEFMEYVEMTEKHDFVENISQENRSIFNTAKQIAVFSAFTEGMQLFSSFVMLLNFPRHGKMKGMGQIITWSIVDEAVAKGTEVLTEGGWKPIETLLLTDKVFQYDMATKETSFVYPQKIQATVREHSYVFESDTIHQHVSPNHRMIIMNEDGTVGEVTAEKSTGDETLILNGNKSGTKTTLSKEDKKLIKDVISGSLSYSMIYNEIPKIDSSWAKDAVNYYLTQKKPKNMDISVKDVFDTLANIAGGVISDDKFVEIETTKVTKTKQEHTARDFYCLAVPGKAFFIRSNGKISVTGNTFHTDSMIKLFRTYIGENKEVWNDELKSALYNIAEKMVELEDKFIDLSYEMTDGNMNNLSKDDLKTYIRYIADRRLISMGLKGIFKVKKNPLPWVEEMINAPTHTNFFENRATDYARGALTGDWSDVWAE